MELTEENYFLFAAKYYENPNCLDISEFYNDLSTIIHIKKLLSKYLSSGVLKERLLLNHLICFFNIFDNIAAIKILFFKIEEIHHANLKTTLVFLNRCPDFMKIGQNDIKNIAINDNLMMALKNSVVV